MRAINHALTGAVIGFSISDPVIALPVAFLSHFALDAIPHFGMNGDADLLTRWFKVLLVVDALLCVTLVAILFAFHPTRWIAAACCAFLAASPDLFSIGKFRLSLQTQHVPKNVSWFARFHGEDGIQWFQRPLGLAVELAWAPAMVLLLVGLTR